MFPCFESCDADNLNNIWPIAMVDTHIKPSKNCLKVMATSSNSVFDSAS